MKKMIILITFFYYCIFTNFAIFSQKIEPRNPFSFKDNELEKKVQKIATEQATQMKIDDTEWQIIATKEDSYIVKHKDGMLREIKYRKSPSTYK